jgi:hypothetical protein
MTIAGTETKKVKKMRTEFAIAAIQMLVPSFHNPIPSYPPVNGHVFSSKSVATLSSVGVCVTSDFVISAKTNSNPPHAAKRRSTRT